MKFPYIVQKNLSEEQIIIWLKVYAPSKGSMNDKTIEEGLWRRTQNEQNAEMSGWAKPSDKRRKILYYKHCYDIIDDKGAKHLVLSSTYIFLCLTMPRDEITEYHKLFGLDRVCDEEGIFSFAVDDLIFSLVIFNDPSEYAYEIDTFPEDYKTLVISVCSKGYVADEKTKEKPWAVLKTGMRKALRRGTPTYLSEAKEIVKFFPVQVMLGCGPSCEAGIPPLHYLHDLYSIEQPFARKFIFEAERDIFVQRLAKDTEGLYKDLLRVFTNLINAKPTPFYFVLKELFECGFAVGPIITNNFDGLHLRLSLPEKYIRRYEEENIIPSFDFDPRAKALLVVGSHADRRRIEERARVVGLTIVYIDPEGWFKNGKFYPYILESPQDNDFILKKGATKAFLEMKEYIQNTNNK